MKSNVLSTRPDSQEIKANADLREVAPIAELLERKLTVLFVLLKLHEHWGDPLPAGRVTADLREILDLSRQVFTKLKEVVSESE